MRAGGCTGAVTAAIEMLRVGSDVVDVGPAASHPDASQIAADEIRRIAPLLDALSDQMHRFQSTASNRNPALKAGYPTISKDS